MFGLGFQEILFLLLIALLLFGSSKLPEVGRSLGKAIREFKKASQPEEKEDKPGDEQNKGKS
jgi:sec-independent protein translocase protein TatA